MRRVVLDIETNGFLDDLTRVHCLVLRDMDSDKILSCTNDDGKRWKIEAGLQALATAEKIYGHNIVGFDLPAIKKVYPSFELRGQVRDTYLAASMRWAHIKEVDFAQARRGQLPGRLIGNQSLEAWGYRLGVLKGDYKKTNDFSVWTPEMQAYCEQDTAVTKALVQRIEAAGVSAEAMETEHELAEYLFHQERNGWPFDIEKAHKFQAMLSAKRQELDTELRTLFEPWQVSLGMFTPKVNNPKRGYVKGVEIERFKTVEFNPGSRDHIANRLKTLYGWEPSQFTASGKPEVDENTLKGLDYPPVVRLRDYLLVSKRLGQLSEGKQSWLNHVTDKKPGGGQMTGLSHIHGRCIQNRAITHRAAHSNPNIGQVPKVTSEYGPECRELFYAGPKGWSQVGADVSGLELRVLAHYMARYDDGAYGVGVLAEKPNDVHTLNANILGISRDDGKTLIYALLYGAGDEKLGKILAPGKSPAQHKKIGAAARKKFLTGVAALGHLIKDVRRNSSKKGYLKLIDGRRCYIRSEHAALNSLIQGTGAVICKRWIVEYNRRLIQKIGPQGWDGNWAALGWIHDETQVAVKTQYVEDYKTTVIASIRAMQGHFNFRLPLDGEAIVGANWKECH